MSLTQVTGPYPIFTDLDGSPLDDGYLYIGDQNDDPETNPIQVYWDSALTIPATQPIRTNSGYAWRNGTPGLLYTAGAFSITIRNKRNEFVLYSPVGYGFDPAAVSASVVKNDFVGDGVDTTFTLSAAPSTILATNVFINGVYQEKDSYSLLGNVITFSIAPPLNSSIEVMTNETGVINSGNATAISYTASFAGAVAQTVQTKLEQTVSVKDFGAVGDGVTDDTAALTAAITAANTTGEWLNWNKGTYRITSALSFTLTKMRWMSEGAIIFIDTTGDILRGLDVTLSDTAEHQLLGAGFEVNANGKCHGALRFIQPLGTQTASIYLEKVGARNVQMQVGVGVGSSGLDVRGGFKQAKLIDCYAENIMMRTGAGVIGSRGVTGIILQNNFGTTGAYIKNMILVRPTINRVYSQDAAYQYDMDGIGIFANPADATFGPAYAEITSSDISGCWGRDAKIQASAAKVDSPNSLVNDGPSGGIVNPTYDFQTGPGVLIGGQYTVDGVSHTAGLVGFQITTDGAPMSSRWDGGAVDIINSGALSYVVGTDSIGAVTKFVASVSSVSVRGAIANFAFQRTNGFDIHTIKLDGIVCESITDALVNVISGSGGTAPYRGRVFVKNCINLGSDIPTVRCNTVGNIAGALLDDVGGIGFGPDGFAYDGSATTLSGLGINDSAQLPIPLTNGTNSGTEKLYSFLLDAGASITLPSHGFNGNYLAYLVIGTSRTGFAELSVDGSGIVSVDVGAGANIGTTSDPGSGDLRIWRSTGTNQLVVKNGTASGRVFLAKFFG
jgi:hypothetical protein